MAFLGPGPRLRGQRLLGLWATEAPKTMQPAEGQPTGQAQAEGRLLGITTGGLRLVLNVCLLALLLVLGCVSAPSARFCRAAGAGGEARSPGQCAPAPATSRLASLLRAPFCNVSIRNPPSPSRTPAPAPSSSIPRAHARCGTGPTGSRVRAQRLCAPRLAADGHRLERCGGTRGVSKCWASVSQSWASVCQALGKL